MVINHLLTGVILQVKHSKSQNGDDFCPPILMGLYKSQNQWYTITYLPSHFGPWNNSWNGLFLPTKKFNPQTFQKIGHWLSE